MDKFMWGAVAALAGIMAIQDWYGLDGYIEHVRANWLELPWFVGASVFIISVIMGRTSKK